MRSTAIAALALAGVVSTFAATPARADAPIGAGLICQFATVVDPTAEPGTQSGELSGGPVLLTEQDGFTPETGTLTCRVQVGTSDHTGSGPAVSGHGTGAITAGPAVVNILANADVYLCSEFTDDSDGVTYYWDAVAGEWSADPNTPCEPSFPLDCADCPPYIRDLLRDLFNLSSSLDSDTRKRLLDSILCPILAQVFPPEGDIPGVWDCPPYGNV
jgi:hypothetical protein